MLKLVVDHVQSKVSFELEYTPRFAGFDVIFPSSQEQEIGDQCDSQGFSMRGSFLVTWCSPNPKPDLSSLKRISMAQRLW
jgi:hypothetical protein